MIRFSSIRFRIAAWYFLSAAPIVAGLAMGSWFAMRASMYYSIDEEIYRQTVQVSQFVQAHGDNTVLELQQEASHSREIPLAGGLFQLYDANRKLLFETPALTQHHIALPAETTSNNRLVIYRDSAPSGNRVRFGARPMNINGKEFMILAAQPLREFDQSLSVFAKVLYTAVPVLLLIVAAAGFWLSGRAMAPVDQINREARAIGPENLTARLSVPEPEDELRTLSETLNAMLGRIETSVNRVTQFTADASHELRAPLTLIQSASEFLLRRERSREETVEALEEILQEVKRTTNLVDRLLTLARTDSGDVQLQAKPLNLTVLLSEAAESARLLARRKSVHFSCHLEHEPLYVLGDETSLRELFLILLDNAVKYTPRKGTVDMSLVHDMDLATIEVRDTGIGIAEADLPHVFDRFWRADKVRSRETGGAGLGLSIAKRIVDQSHGTIHVESELGRESKFRIELPLLASKPLPSYQDNESADGEFSKIESASVSSRPD